MFGGRYASGGRIEFHRYMLALSGRLLLHRRKPYRLLCCDQGDTGLYSGQRDVRQHRFRRFLQSIYPALSMHQRHGINLDAERGRTQYLVHDHIQHARHQPVLVICHQRELCPRGDDMHRQYAMQDDQWPASLPDDGFAFAQRGAKRRRFLLDTIRGLHLRRFDLDQ